MPDLQELIQRGRFIISDAPERLNVFVQVNGRRNTLEIARLTKRHKNNVSRDLVKLANVGLIRQKTANSVLLKKDGYPVWEKEPLARDIPIRYFKATAALPRISKAGSVSNVGGRARSGRRPPPLRFPTEQEVLEIARNLETQKYEFKGQGAAVQKITKEIAGMLNTRDGGILFYGIADDGTIEGSDLQLSRFDQPLQNSIRNTISPAAAVNIKVITVMGVDVIAVRVPPWNRRDVYHLDARVHVRKGTNVFVAKAEEVRRLHQGEYIT